MLALCLSRKPAVGSPPPFSLSDERTFSTIDIRTLNTCCSNRDVHECGSGYLAGKTNFAHRSGSSRQCTNGEPTDKPEFQAVRETESEQGKFSTRARGAHAAWVTVRNSRRPNKCACWDATATCCSRSGSWQTRRRNLCIVLHVLVRASWGSNNSQRTSRHTHERMQRTVGIAEHDVCRDRLPPSRSTRQAKRTSSLELPAYRCQCSESPATLRIATS